MSEFVVPYTFVPGTKAKAGEVNANFNACSDIINSNTVSIENVNDSIIKKDGSVNFANPQSYRTVPITGATNATPIVITAVGHGRSTGEKVYIDEVTGNTAANGMWEITKLSADSFSLDNSSGNGEYTTGGICHIIPANSQDLVNKIYVDSTFLNKITNCVIASPNGIATSQGTVITVKSGLKALIPNGRNENGSLKNSDLIITEDRSETQDTANASYILFASSEATNQIYKSNSDSIFIQESTPSPSTTRTWYKPSANKWYRYLSNSWVEYPSCPIAKFQTDINKNIINLQPFYSTEILKRSDFLIGADFKTVVESYKNGNSWYRLWSDGWIEQGGYASAVNNAGQTVTLLKSYRYSDYTVTTGRGTAYTGLAENIMVSTRYPNYFILYATRSEARDTYWQSSGY